MNIDIGIHDGTWKNISISDVRIQPVSVIL